MLIATHAAAICEAIAPTGCTVVGLTVSAQRGDYGAIRVAISTPDSHYLRYILADVGPAGPHAWRWMEPWSDDWSEVSVDTAADALARSVGVE